ncbi:MAG: hypothetical protein JOZ82_12150 [Marmoricola sp.]|nr:hypothetical protein [Marmoricola sp.]
MDSMQAVSAPSGLGTTALGRLQLRVPEEDGFEDVVIERRWPDMAAARAWCERVVSRAVSGSTVLEIQVFGESWAHAKSWETTQHHPVADTLQLGMVTLDGDVRWSTPRSMSPHSGARHLL